MQTIQVKPWSDDQGDFVVINADEFDPAVHVAFDPSAADADADEGPAALSKAEIITDLEVLGVDYDPRARKSDLLALRDEARAIRDA